MRQPDSEQLELFQDEPFSLRLKIEHATAIFWDNYWRHLPSANVTAAHRDRILLFFKDRFIDTISKADIEDFRRYLKDAHKLGPATINKAHMLLSRLFSKLAEYKEGKHAHGVDYSRLVIPSQNPCAQVPRVKERQFARKTTCTPDQLKRFLYYADDDMTDIIRMLIWTRLRPCDLKRMTSANVDLQRGRIEGIQNKNITTRNPSGTPYIVVITQKIADILLPRLARTKPNAPLFPLVNWQKRVQRIRELANVPGFQFGRDFRRTGSAYLLDHGIDAVTVAEGQGLSSLDLLPNYAGRTLAHQRNSTEILEKTFDG